MDRGLVTWDRGFVTAKVLQNQHLAGVSESLQQVRTERRPLNLEAIFPSQILPAYQRRGTAIIVKIAHGHGTFKVELKSPTEEILFSREISLTGGPRTLRFTLPNPAPSNVQMINWLVTGPAGSFAKVTRIALKTTGRDWGRLESFLWPYAALLANWDSATGRTRDLSTTPSGHKDNTSASGLQALTAVVAQRLGIISAASAVDIVEKTTSGLLAVPTVHGVLPHFVEGTTDPQNKPGDEYSSLDTLIAWLAVLQARQSLGLPTQAIEQELQDIDWEDLRLANGTISHGYSAAGERLPFGWDTFGGETFLAVFGQAMARPNQDLPSVPFPTPRTANGSGFIDELASLFVPIPLTDYWGNNWPGYVSAATRNSPKEACRAFRPTSVSVKPQLRHSKTLRPQP